jgi:hypothetical protein
MATRDSQLQNVYHECQRCGTSQPLSDMRWQNGIIVCHTYACVDTSIIGSRDLAVAKALAIPRDELVPDKKLTNPEDRRADEMQVLF